MRSSQQELKALEGTWQLEAQEFDDGTTVPTKYVRRTRLVIKDNKFSVLIDGEPDGASNTISINPSKEPKTLNRTVNIGRKRIVVKYIYEFEGDTIRLAQIQDQGKRPKSFEKQRGLVVSVYKRLKLRSKGRSRLTLKRR